ncbi:hypothetical protein CL656_06710 [bacterium]|nr:hypothetical protein [bacterium]|tara:strand:+ start:3809 stop:5224 length:1416 start_codon:yes stop_codon:yes gene_type:complete
MKIQAKISNLIQDFIDNNDLFKIKDLHEGVIHIGFPDGMKENIHRFESTLDQYDLDYKVYFAHKSSKNRTFVNCAKKENIYIDVASKNELLSALKSGFTGDKIEATGPKNLDFLKLAFENNCLISLDSKSELERLIQIKEQSNLPDSEIQVLIRVNSLEVNGRSIQIKESRFGVNPSQIQSMFDLCRENNIDFQGFHFHADGYDFTMKAGFLEAMFDLIKLSFQEGFTPSIINLGGSFRDQTLENYQDWSHYLEKIEQSMIEDQKLPTWANQSFGLSLNNHGRIAGKEKAMSVFYNSRFEEDLRILLTQNDAENRALADVITENMLTLVIEPGFALLQQAGISLATVIETKKASDGRNLVVLDANIYNLGLAKMFKYYTEPIHISKEQNQNSNPEKFPAFIVGNLCREDDFIMDRLVEFDQQPKAGDILIFTNTAAYHAGFEDATPIMHPNSKFLTASKTQDNKWEVTASN